MKTITLSILLCLMGLSFSSCSSKKNYNNKPLTEQATLHILSNGKKMLGIEMKNIVFLQINGEEIADSLDALGKDEQVNSGKVNIFIKYYSENFFAITNFTFNAIAGKKYDIQGKRVNKSIKFTISVDNNIFLKQKEDIEKIPPPIYIPIYI